MKKILILIFIKTTLSQDIEVLNRYYRLAVENNLELKQKDFSYKSQVKKYEIVRASYYPKITMQLRYSVADGGRNFKFPLGDLFNPVYSELSGIYNELSLQNPGRAAEYTAKANVYGNMNLQNQSFSFMRDKEHESKINLQQHLFNLQLFHYIGLERNLITVNKLEQELYKQFLMNDLAKSYYNYLKLEKLELLYNKNLLVLKEHIRVNKVLFEQDKVTEDQVLKSEAEYLKREQERSEILSRRESLKQYFNYLLNRDLSEKIEIEKSPAVPGKAELNLKEMIQESIDNRVELKQVRAIINVKNEEVSMNQGKYFPNLMLNLDYGYQGEKYRIHDNDNYWMASFVLQWNLFNGFADQASIEKAEIEMQSKELLELSLKEKIKLQCYQSKTRLENNYRKMIAANKALSSSQAAYTIAQKRFENGMINQLEYLDAQRQLLEAEVNQAISSYDYIISNIEKDYILGRLKMGSKL